MTEPAKIPYSMPFNWDKYIGECSRFGLTPEQQGAYMKLICTFWGNRCKPLIDDPEKMARITGFTVDRWTRKIRPGLTDLFVISEEGWAHEWIEEEWHKTVQKIAVKSANGKRGGRGHSKGHEREIENPLREISAENSQSQNAKSLENNETDKATAFSELSVSLSTYNQSKKEESKNPPLSPPMGGPANGVLFPAQEVQHAPPKASNSKKPRGRGQKALPVPEEIFEVYWELRPPSESKSHHNKTAARTNFAKAVQSGVDPQEMIQAYANYRDEAKYKGKFGTDYVKSAQRFIALDERKWEQHITPFIPPKTNNVHQFRANGTTGAPMPVTRGGVQY